MVRYVRFREATVEDPSFQFLEYAADGNGGWIALAWQPYNWNLILYTLAVVPVTILVGYLANRVDNLLIRKLTSKNTSGSAS